ncbi:NAD-dependent succinate-semialdehyde dehydrogenase [Melioribacteraceae bacterium 4301-Me]|uniref:NAD-dependent succinate-semialdehyde dehydrogenase n=1 Tax=Pyranulibacter aquaticus TaxID=3163344 RepID=UPI0035997D07
MAIQSINPATGKLEKTFNEFSLEEVFEIIEKTHETFLSWRTTSFSERKTLMNYAASVMRNKKNYYAEIITKEMGKPIKQSIAEVEKCAWVCEYFAENAESFLHNEKVNTDATESYVQFDPIGVVLAVMPWNFPFWQVFRFAAPALMAGNVGVLKHSSNVPMCALAIEEIFQSAGFPKYTFSALLIGSNKVKDIIKHPKIKAATLTGSESAGRQLAKFSGEQLKKTVLELGGSDPFIVLEDANLDEAVNTAVTARLINNGQSCIAAKRFIVVEKIFEEFKQKFIDKMERIVIGDPIDEKTELGPIAREDLLHELDTQVKKSVQMGAEILTGAKILPRQGFYYSPTILTNLKKGMPAYDEEIFGPVASLIKAQDENEAIRIANDTDFGLGASVWTNNIQKAKKIATEIQTGNVFINDMVKSDPRLPFGGVKNSGYGRELSTYGIKEFVNIKTVWIK